MKPQLIILIGRRFC